MATSTIQTNDFGDIYLPDGKNLGIISGIDACKQSIVEATRLRLGENQYDTTEGVDYLGTIFTPQQNFAAFRNSLINAILSSPDVISVEELALSQVNNVIKYDAQINTIYGVVLIGG